MPEAMGDVLCPTCGQWTPPAPFCTECGAALQGDVLDPAPGSSDSDVFRRGHEVDRPGAPWGGAAERFEPEPEDKAAVAAAGAAAAGAPIDHLTETEVGAQPPSERKPATPTPPDPRRTRAKAAPAAVTPAVAATIVEPPSPPPPPPPARPTTEGSANGGVSGAVFVLFLGLGILALLGGAILGGVFDGEPSADATPTPTQFAATPTPEETPGSPTPEPSTTPRPPTPTPNPSAGPTTFPDGFLARAEVCLEQPSDSTCGNDGAVNDGDLWVLVSFRHGKPDDVIGVAIVDSSGTLRGDGSLDLSFCGSNTDCAGYTYFRFGTLEPGDYTVRASRNGTLAAQTTFTVE